MICIIAHHLCYHGDGVLADGFNKVLMQIFLFGGKYGVDLFIILSGYCLINSKFTFRKLFKLLIQVILYSVSIYLIFLCCGLIRFNFKELIKVLFPTIFQQYWFVTCYIIVYVFSPFINKMLKSFSRKEYTVFMILTFSILFIGKYVGFISPNYVWFFAIYFLGAGMALHPLNIYSKKSSSTAFLIVMLSLIVLVKLINFSNIFELDNLFVILASAATLLFFRNINIKSKFINRIASTTFGVYLIHDNNYIRSVLWKNIFKTYSIMGSSY